MRLRIIFVEKVRYFSNFVPETSRVSPSPLLHNMKFTFFENKLWWKVGLLIAALLIISISLLYTGSIVKQLGEQERKKAEIWASAVKGLNDLPLESSDPNMDIIYIVGLLSGIIKDNETIPVILTDGADNIIQHNNVVKENKNAQKPAELDSAFLKKELKRFKKAYDPIEINLNNYGKPNEPPSGNAKENRQRVYFFDSNLLYRLRIYPYIQFGIVGLFFVIAYMAFSTARRHEQNRVWLGLAKETAHQLGTPISSIIGWIELLKDTDGGETEMSKLAAHELEKDANRLRLVSERFSKIGSSPELKRADLNQTIADTVDYMRARASHHVSVNYEGLGETFTKHNPVLLGWVIENLLKNALDAMGGRGAINVRLTNIGNAYQIDVSDTGKGIPKTRHSAVFETGFSTKQRGWGLGLSLSKRIVELYHTGKINVHESAPGKGTTFRILLPNQ